MSDTTTRGLRIQVRPQYLAEQSNAAAGRWLFAYEITLHNHGDEAVQLLNRHWVITNGEGAVDEVRGPGVVGQQPVLAPGDAFTYTSGCPLDTPVGTMHGEYEMLVVATGERFEAVIAPFRLAVPSALN